MRTFTRLSVPVLLLSALFYVGCDSGSSDSGDPELGVDPGKFSITKDANSDVFRISNEGSGELAWEISSKPDWVSLSKMNGNVRVGSDAVTATADIDREDGTYTGTISITSNGGDFGLTVTLDISTWVRKADMPGPRWGLSSSVVEGKVYVIGGSSGDVSNIPKAVLEYDPAADAWSEKAKIHTARVTHCAAVVGGLIYVIGGDAGGSVPTALPTEVYNPVEDTWTEKAPLPEPPRGGLSCEAVDGKIYVIGGTYGPDYPALQFVDQYDPATDAWTRKDNMPTARWYMATAEVAGTILALGGHNVAGVDDAGLGAAEAYDCAADTWAQVENMPTRRTALGAIALNGKVYAIGGGPSWDALPVNEAYDPTTNTWTPKTGMLAPRQVFGIAAVNGKIYVIGGATGHNRPALGTVEEYTPAP